MKSENNLLVLLMLGAAVITLFAVTIYQENHITDLEQSLYNAENPCEICQIVHAEDTTGYAYDYIRNEGVCVCGDKIVEPFVKLGE